MLQVLARPPRERRRDTTPALTAGEAVRAVQDAVGVVPRAPAHRGPAGATRGTTYADGTSAALALCATGWRGA